MKTINIKTIILFSLFISFLSCKAQEYPLNTDFRNIPDYSYLKDLNNELNPYIGTYTSTYNGNNIIIYINKQEKTLKNFGSQKFYKDVYVYPFLIIHL